MSTSAVTTRNVSKRNLPFQPWAKPAAAAPWVRPSAWLALPDISAQQRAAGLVRIDKDGNFLAVTAAGAYTVDWGDGTTTNHNSNTTAYKEYNYADIADTGESELGYRQVIVQIYPQSGQNITSLNFNVRHNRAGLNTTYVAGWLDLWVNCANLTSLTIGAASSTVCNVLQFVRLGTTACTSYAGLFRNLTALVAVDIANTSVALVDMSSMLSGCSSLATVPLFDTGSVTDMSNMFNGCNSLATVPLFDTSSVTTMSFMFFGCRSLATVPLFNTGSVTNMSNMFVACLSLTTVPLFNTSSVTTINGMFNGCNSLATVPLFNTSSVTSINSMFSNCSSLATVPLFNTGSVTDMNGMFNGCNSLATVPLFNTSSVTNMNNMFNGCSSLATVPLFNTGSVTNMSNMFNSCFSLATVPLFNTSSVTTINGMFNGCNSLATVPLFNTGSVTNMSFMFFNCSSLATVPLFNTSSVTDMNNMFNSCRNLSAIPAFNCNAVTNALSNINSSVSVVDLLNIRTTISFSGCKLSKAEIEKICTNLTAGTGSRTLTLTNNYGLDRISRAGYGTTAGSATVTQTNTANLETGMLVTGTNISGNRAVTFQDTGNTVTRTAHGLANGNLVSFTTITSTTGIVTNTPYFVVNATADTFQVADTEGGAAKALTTNGSGNMISPSYITGITANTSITLSLPAITTGTNQTLVATKADFSLAQLKGYAVTT